MKQLTSGLENSNKALGQKIADLDQEIKRQKTKAQLLNQEKQKVETKVKEL